MGFMAKFFSVYFFPPFSLLRFFFSIINKINVLSPICSILRRRERKKMFLRANKIKCWRGSIVRTANPSISAKWPSGNATLLTFRLSWCHLRPNGLISLNNALSLKVIASLLSIHVKFAYYFALSLSLHHCYSDGGGGSGRPMFCHRFPLSFIPLASLSLILLSGLGEKVKRTGLCEGRFGLGERRIIRGQTLGKRRLKEYILGKVQGLRMWFVWVWMVKRER